MLALVMIVIQLKSISLKPQNQSIEQQQFTCIAGTLDDLGTYVHLSWKTFFGLMMYRS